MKNKKKKIKFPLVYKILGIIGLAQAIFWAIYTNDIFTFLSTLFGFFAISALVVNFISFINGLWLLIISLIFSPSKEKQYKIYLKLVVFVITYQNNTNQFDHDKIFVFLYKKFSKEKIKFRKKDLISELESGIDINLEDLLKHYKYLSRKHVYSLLYSLFNMAVYDSKYNKNREFALKIISNYLGIHEKVFTRIKYMFVEYEADENSQRESQKATVKQDYNYLLSCKILGIESNSDLVTIKKQYRRLAKEHHPDKYAYLGENQMKQAEKMFQKIQNAYEIVMSYK